MNYKLAEITEKKFWSMSQEEVAGLFGTDTAAGLSVAEASERLAAFGKNTIQTSRGVGWIAILVNQLKSPLILVLILAGGITFAISHYRDAAFILIAVVVNTALGFYQENKAERALSQLKTYIRQRAKVVREGKEKEIDAEDIVPGDVVRLAQGDRVPADARVIFVNDFQVDEAVLTGESLPVGKSVQAADREAALADQSSMVFAGTLVTQGVCAAIVCRTDSSTELGKIASLLASSENEKTPLQAAIGRFSVHSSIILSAMTLVVFIVGILSGYSGVEMFLTAVAIAVSAIPEGLPVSMTVILATGVERMAKRKGVVRRLVAAEALGSTTVILTDKTGTLTMAKMVMSKVLPFGDLSENRLLMRALTNTNVIVENPNDTPDTWLMSGRIMEKALVQSAALRGVSFAEISNKEHVLETLPFNSEQKFSAALVREGNKHLLVFFGAPDILLSHSSLSSAKGQEMLEQINELASSGERVLGVATKEVTKAEGFVFEKEAHLQNLSFDGLISFRDPVRAGIKHAIERVKYSGIKTVIMTGDHRGTAVAVAREIGMEVGEDSVIDAAELTKLSDTELAKRLPKLSVIARVTPFDKLRVAKMYQAQGEVVAMTGDGVNDAPSIKQANVGIAMGSGTEVAQSVADLVLLDDNFETIVAAVEEGRQILGNIRKVLVYLLSNVADGLVLIGGSLLVGLPLPLNALQILWVNFFADSFPAVAFAFEKDPDGLAHKPHNVKKGLFDPLMRFLILVIGLSSSLLLFALYTLLTKHGIDEQVVRTFIFASFGTYTLLMALSVRSLDKSIFSYSIFSNHYLTYGITIGVLLMAAAIYHPLLQNLFGTVSLSLVWVAAVVLIGLFNIALIEIAKGFFRNKNNMKYAK